MEEATGYSQMLYLQIGKKMKFTSQIMEPPFLLQNPHQCLWELPSDAVMICLCLKWEGLGFPLMLCEWGESRMYSSIRYLLINFFVVFF